MKNNENNFKGEKKMEIAKEILNQLGGHRFIAMTGAKNLVANKDSLTFKISSRNKSKASNIKIRLNAMDTYDMFFIKCFKHNVKDMDFAGGIYNDQLREVFTSKTGLQTAL